MNMYVSNSEYIGSCIQINEKEKVEDVPKRLNMLKLKDIYVVVANTSRLDTRNDTKVTEASALDHGQTNQPKQGSQVEQVPLVVPAHMLPDVLGCLGEKGGFLSFKVDNGIRKFGVSV